MDKCAKHGQTGSKGQWHYYYHTAQQRDYDYEVRDKGIRTDKLEAQWGEIVSSIVLPDDWKQTIERLSGDASQ